jgi:polysaccharide biosynthesis PFTS motif protein
MRSIASNFCLGRRRRAKVRAYMRGYRKLRDTGRLALAAQLKDRMAYVCPQLHHPTNGDFFFGAGRSCADRVLVQYLLVRFAGLEFNRCVATSGNERSHISLPLPRAWRDILREAGISVAETKSRLKWRLEVAKQLIRGSLITASLVLQSWRSKCSLPAERAFFYGIAESNLPLEKSAHPQSRNIFSWYAHWPGRSKKICVLEHDSESASPRKIDDLIVRTGKPIPLPRTPAGRAALLRWAAVAILLAVRDLMQGRWVTSVLLGECARAACVRFTERESLPKVSLFHNSSWLYRPLWTYEAASRGSDCVVYFYSTNIISLKTKTEDSTQENCWHSVTWPNYLVWTEAQRQFIRSSCDYNAHIEVVGEIDFVNTLPIPPNISPGFLALFDVQPVRDSFYQSLGLSPEYYIPDVAVRFVEDVFELAKHHRLAVVYKMKRDIGKKLHRRYRAVIEKLAEDPQFKIIDASIDVFELAQQSCLGVSMPFTSTAHWVRKAGKPSCFYDPTESLLKDDEASNGINFVAGKMALGCWIERSLQKQEASHQTLALSASNILTTSG